MRVLLKYWMESQKKPIESLNEEDFSFALNLSQDSVAYRAALTTTDYDLMLKAADWLYGTGRSGLKYQSVLVNTLAQDSSLFDTMDAKKQAEYRTKAIEIFTGIYELAYKHFRPDFDSRGANRPFEINEKLLGEMLESGVSFDEKGKPFGDKFNGKLKERYDSDVSQYLSKRSEAETQKNIKRILDKDKTVLIRRMFIERYRRQPVDYDEAVSFLERIKGVDFQKSDILCAIEMETQVKIPEKYKIDCGEKFGTGSDF